uniref:hypothetical protein n=1 Tax=Salmonella sp. s51228 TaxID=3159652 RepID=UPI0039805281
MASNNNDNNTPVEPESNILNLLDLLRNKVNDEFDRIQTHLNERRAALLTEINELEQKYKQSCEASEGKILLEKSKKDMLKVASLFGSDKYKSTLEEMEIDLRKMLAQIV